MALISDIKRVKSLKTREKGTPTVCKLSANLDPQSLYVCISSRTSIIVSIRCFIMKITMAHDPQMNEALLGPFLMIKNVASSIFSPPQSPCICDG